MKSSDFIINVENISKEYYIGKSAARFSLREALSYHLKRPVKKLGALFRNECHQVIGLDSKIWALKDISFTVCPGEVLGIIGNNGSGKSTLLKILSKITSPTQGRAYLRGRIASLLEVGTGFHPELSGRENIYLNGSILGMSRKEISEKFDEIVDFAGVEKFVDTPIKHYSSGMYVRLAFAVAAHLDPEILMIDEVLAVGDIRFQRKCLSKMEDISGSGRTVLFVSHNMAAVQSLCHRVLWLDNGNLVDHGKVDDVVGRYMERSFISGHGKYWSEPLAPGNQAVKVLGVSAVNKEGQELSAFPISKPVVIKIQYKVIEEGAQVGFSLSTFDKQGRCIFSTLSNHEKCFYGKSLPKGVYISECIIPGDTFNDGMFPLSLTGFNAQWSDSFTIDSPISLTMVDDGVLKGDYMGNFGGVLRPRLQWETSKIEEIEEINYGKNAFKRSC